MKKFSFPLERVLEWRRTKVSIEEAKLGRLHLELRGLESRAARARAEGEQTRKQLQTVASIMSAELIAFDTYKKFLQAESLRLDGLAAGCRERIAAQMLILTAAHRDVKLLERLHARKREAWDIELSKEIDREAAELHLANLARA